MKYVFNKGRYDLAFEIVVSNRERKVEFYRRRLYKDTGNVAVSGITAVEDDIYDILLKNKRFKTLIDSGEFELTEASQLETTEKVNKELKEEVVRLNKALKEANKKATPKEVEKTLKDKDDEINSLKAKLEALTKAQADEAKETDGF